MENQKLENLLNLAMDATEEEREKSAVLEVGYNPIDREWDLIIKYSGDLEPVRELASHVTELLNEYAVITIRESLIDRLADIPQVEYVEKPKRLYFQVVNGRRVSCIDEVQGARFGLRGQGTLVAVIDSGIDYTLPDFRNADGSTRIKYLWDQSLGEEYTEERINEALQASVLEERYALVPSRDTSGHGTAVAGIAAGSGAYAGVAPESELIVVKLGIPRQEGFPRTTELMLGVDYVVRKAIELRKPMAVNISFGNSYGAHNGQSLLERYLDSVAGLGRICICVGAGNEGRGAGHTSGILRSGEEQRIELAVQERETGVNVQVWKAYTDEMQISLINPSGVRVGPFQEILGPQRFTVGQTEILLYYGKPSPYSTRQEIFIDFLPRETYVAPGIWQIILSAGHVVSGRYDLWLPGASALNVGTGFTTPSPQVTITIPSTASRIITVGAYDALTFTYADFSGRGPIVEPDFWEMVKPDIAAPGVKITTVAAGGGYAEFTGTSFATPFVTGSAALLMEWGIVQGNDPFLYGEKVKAYFRRGARPLPGFAVYPNNQVGYGALCVRDSLPV
ncbi:MAG: S8 family peptidase [Eubacteriales bacterium]|nr:S8 family peptidase [Eubacteriales bacterium]